MCKYEPTVTIMANHFNLLYIEKCGFDEFNGLTFITIPKSVNTICSDAFNDCSKLSNAVFIGNQPANFEEYAFNDTKDDFKITISPTATGFGKPDPYNNETTWSWSPNYSDTYKVVIGDTSF